jgi:beta-hydroxyacyl-ACP dehydratase FabZ
VLSVQDIQEILPHRYPFLLVDKIVVLEPNERIVGIKNVTMNEPFFVGHFPGRPVMPGVMILEAMAQTAAILALKSPEGMNPDKLILLVGADGVRWKRQVLPGDTLRIEMVVERKRHPIWSMKGTVTVDGKVVAVGVLSAASG